MLGVLMGVLAAICWGAGAVFARLGLQYMRATTATFLSLVVGALMLLVVVLALYWNTILALSAVTFLWFFVIGVVNFPMGRFFNFNAVRLAGVARSTPIVAAAPLFAVALATLLLGEPITPMLLGGTLAIVGGIVLIMSAR